MADNDDCYQDSIFSNLLDHFIYTISARKRTMTREVNIFYFIELLHAALILILKLIRLYMDEINLRCFCEQYDHIQSIMYDLCQI